MAVMQASEAKINFTKTRLASPDGNLWNLPKPGMILIKPTSIANSGGSASIGTNGQVTFTSVTSLSLNGVFSSTYDNYVVSIRCQASGNTDSYIRWRSAGSDNTTANSYVSQYLSSNGTTVSGERLTNTFGYFMSTYNTQRDGFTGYIYGPFLSQPTSYRTVSMSGFNSATIADYAGTHNQSSSYDGFTLYQATVAITGALQVYGVRS